MAQISINSEEKDIILDGQKTESLDNFIEALEEVNGTICNCLRYLGRSGRTYMYTAYANGCVVAYFSKNGRVTSSIRQRVYNGNNYNFTPLSGETLGFTCC